MAVGGLRGRQPDLPLGAGGRVGGRMGVARFWGLVGGWHEREVMQAMFGEMWRSCGGCGMHDDLRASRWRGTEAGPVTPGRADRFSARSAAQLPFPARQSSCTRAGCAALVPGSAAVPGLAAGAAVFRDGFFAASCQRGDSVEC